MQAQRRRATLFCTENVFWTPGTHSGCAASSCFTLLVAEERVPVRARAAAQVGVPLILIR